MTNHFHWRDIANLPYVVLTLHTTLQMNSAFIIFRNSTRSVSVIILRNNHLYGGLRRRRLHATAT